MRKLVLAILLGISTFFMPLGQAFAKEEADFKAWTEVASEMGQVLDEAYDIYSARGADFEKKARDQVNVAYYQYYEKIGFERTTMARISGNRASAVELQFSRVKKTILAQESNEAVQASLGELKTMLMTDASQLDGAGEGGNFIANLIASLLIILREGFEAILIVGAIIAYLVKSQNQNRLGHVYQGSIWGIVASVVMAVILMSLAASAGKDRYGEAATKLYEKEKAQYEALAADEALKAFAPSANKIRLQQKTLTEKITERDLSSPMPSDSYISTAQKILTSQNDLTLALKNASAPKATIKAAEGITSDVGALIARLQKYDPNKKQIDPNQQQEVIEGLTMFLAVLVLFYVSNWMVSKASSKAWSNYIKGKVQTSIAKGSMFSLAFTCFLAVFREGAEVILFYQALLVNAQGAGDTFAIWLGLAIGAVLLVFVYLAIRYLGVKLPLKPFFLATSILMFVMCVSFVGSGISEFVDADWFTPHILNHVPTISILGIYPYAESLIAQGIMIVIIALTLGIGYAIQRKKQDAQDEE